MNLGLDGNIKIKINSKETYLLAWNDIGKYCIVKINGLNPSLFTCKTNVNFSFVAPNEPEFSPDGTMLILEFDNLSNFLMYNISTTTPSLVRTLTMKSVIEKVQFIDDNSTYALFRGNKISYFSTKLTT